MPEANARLEELVESVERDHERVVLTRGGLPVAVLVSADEIEALEETIAILEEPGLLESVRRSRAEAAGGKSSPLE